MMQSVCLILVFILCFLISYFKATTFEQPTKASPFCYGCSSSLVSMFCALSVFVLLKIFTNIRPLSFVILSAVFSGILHWNVITPAFRARYWCETALRFFLRSASLVALLITLFITLLLIAETTRFFDTISPTDFIFGLQWSPETTFNDIAVGADRANFGQYGAVPLFLGSLMITCIALVIATPVGLMIALYLKEYAKPTISRILKPLIELLAGIPSIVYGFFALIVVMPALQRLGEAWAFDISAQSALGVGIVMGLMIIPYVSSLSEEALRAVPQALRDNSLALGATSAETIQKVVLPAALPGIITAVLLAFSRAIGETMLVVMAAGLSARLTLNPLDSVTTVTVQMINLLTGDQEFNSPKTLSAFALGMSLFLLTLGFNILSNFLLTRHRKKYGL